MNIRSSSSKDGLAALVNKLENLGQDMKKLKESVHAIQVGCQICEVPHLDKDCPLIEEVKEVEEIDNRSPYGEKRQNLEELLIKHKEESARRSIEMEIEQLIEELHSRKEKSEQAKVVIVEHEGPSSPKKLKNLHGISFLSDSQEENTIDQLPTKESNPGHFTLPCTIGDKELAGRQKYSKDFRQISNFKAKLKEILVFCIWKAFGSNTYDLGSFGEETDKTTYLHQHCSRISPQKLETTSQITRDAVTMISKMASQDLKTVSDDTNLIRTLGDYSKPSYEGYRNTIELPVGKNVCEINHPTSGKLHNKNADESWEFIENLALYDNEGWDDTKEFIKLVKAIATPQGIQKTPDQRLL
ncbi:hypothetical protein Tco_0200446 [Tanacetum coccineum]